MAATLVMWPGAFEKSFRSPIPRWLRMKFDFNRPSGYSYKSIRDQIWPCRKNGSGLTHGQYLNKLGSTRAPCAAYKVSRSSAFWFRRRRFSKVFIIYGHGEHLCHVTWNVWIKFLFPYPWRFHMKFGFNWPSGFREEDVWKCCWRTTYYGRRTTDNRGLPILLARQWAFGSGELKIEQYTWKWTESGVYYNTAVFCSKDLLGI